MGMLEKYLVLLLFSPLLVFAIHAALGRTLMRFGFKVSDQVLVIACAVLGHLPMGAALWYVYFRHALPLSGALTETLYALAVYNALAYGYFHVFNMSDTARRIRILIAVHSSGGLKTNDLAASYGSRDMLKHRLDRLLTTRQVKLNNGRYFLDRKHIYYIALAVAWCGHLLGIPYPEVKCGATKNAKTGQRAQLRR